MEMAISACREQNKFIGICGQAPSDFPEITRWLVEEGIDSISLNPDSVLKMTQVVLDIERELNKTPAAIHIEHEGQVPHQAIPAPGGTPPGKNEKAGLLD